MSWTRLNYSFDRKQVTSIHASSLSTTEMQAKIPIYPVPQRTAEHSPAIGLFGTLCATILLVRWFLNHGRRTRSAVEQFWRNNPVAGSGNTLFQWTRSTLSSVFSSKELVDEGYKKVSSTAASSSVTLMLYCATVLAREAILHHAKLRQRWFCRGAAGPSKEAVWLARKQAGLVLIAAYSDTSAVYDRGLGHIAESIPRKDIGQSVAQESGSAYWCYGGGIGSRIQQILVVFRGRMGFGHGLVVQREYRGEVHESRVRWSSDM